MKLCLVTGGAGFIGSHLVEGLLARGAGVRVLDDLSTGHLANLDAARSRIELVRGSVNDPADAAAAVAGCDTVFHLAAIPSVALSVADPRKVHDVCVTGTLNVLLAARDARVRRLVYAGSASAYGDQPGNVRFESDALIPLSPYAASKLAGEHYCRCFTEVYGLETVRLRFFNVFGPRQDPKNPYSGVIAIFQDLIKRGQAPTIFGDGLQARDFVYVTNVVDALILAADAPGASGQVYNVGMGQYVTLLDLVGHFNQLLGTSLVPTLAPSRPGDIRHSQADISRTRRDLNYVPTVSFLEGLRRTLAAT